MKKAEKEQEQEQYIFDSVSLGVKFIAGERFIFDWLETLKNPYPNIELYICDNRKRLSERDFKYLLSCLISNKVI